MLRIPWTDVCTIINLIFRLIPHKFSCFDVSYDLTCRSYLLHLLVTPNTSINSFYLFKIRRCLSLMFFKTNTSVRWSLSWGRSLFFFYFSFFCSWERALLRRTLEASVSTYEAWLSQPVACDYLRLSSIIQRVSAFQCFISDVQLFLRFCLVASKWLNRINEFINIKWFCCDHGVLIWWNLIFIEIIRILRWNVIRKCISAINILLRHRLL